MKDHPNIRIPGNSEAILRTVLFVAVFAVILAFSRLGVDFHHDGLIFKSAQDVLHGLIPYRESFSQYNLLAVLIHAGALAIGGSTLIALKALTALVYALSAVVLYSIWRRFLTAGYAGLSCVLWLFLGPFYIWVLLPWSSVLALFFQLTGLLLFLRHLESGRAQWLALSGFVVALATWCRQPVGLLEMTALCAILALPLFPRPSAAGFRDAAVRIGLLLAGFAACCCLFLLWLLATGALRDWYLQNYRLAVEFASTIPQSWYGYGGFRGRLFFLLKTLLPIRMDFLLWALLPLNAVALALSLLIKRLYGRGGPERREGALLAVSMVAITSWHQYYPVPCYRHCFWAASVMVGLMVFTVLELARTASRRGDASPPDDRRRDPAPGAPFWEYGLVPVRHAACRLRLLLSRSKAGSAVLTGALLSLIFGYGILFRVDAGVHRWLSNAHELRSPSALAGLYVDDGTADTIRRFDEALRRALEVEPSKNVVTTGPDAFYSFFTDRARNIHPLYVNWDITAAIYPEYPGLLDAYIRSHRPLIVSSGDVYYHLGYRALAHFDNGASLAVPTDSIPNLERARLARTGQPAVLHIGLENDRDDELRRKELDGLRLPPVSIGKDFTLEMLVTARDSVSPEATILGNAVPSLKNGFVVQCVDPARHLYALAVGDGTEFRRILSFPVPPYRPCHVVITRAGSRWTAYVDGAQAAEADSTVAPLESPRALMVGSWVSRSYRFTGRVYELRFFDTALAGRDVQRLHAGITGDGRPSAGSSPPEDPSR